MGRQPHSPYPEASGGIGRGVSPPPGTSGTGILTGFPLREGRLAPPLGPANPRLTTHCRGTLALSAVGIPTRLRSYYRQDLQSDPVHRTSRPDFSPGPTPPYRIRGIRPCPGVSAAGLSPVHFRRPPPRRVSCYALIMRWLLLSLLPRCLRRRTSFRLALSRHLGALTPGWVVPLSAQELTPWSPTGGVYGDRRFGV